MDVLLKPPFRRSLSNRLGRFYLWLLMLALPIDWFGPTGMLLREGGAKPAIPLMLTASLLVLLFWPKRRTLEVPLATIRILAVFALIFLCGVFGFCCNLLMGWSRFDAAKTPLAQFVSQALLFLLTPIILFAHTEVFRSRYWACYAIDVIPWVAGIHLAVAGLELAHIFNYARVPLSLFRTGYEGNSMRLSGMTSEPSYFGTMAAMYALPLLLAFPNRLRWTCRFLALLLLVSALAAGGKTVVPVFLCGLFAYTWYARVRLFSSRNIALALALASLASVFVIKTGTLDLRDNLSSAMRFGSTLTSVNVALAGYGLTGVGFGQFHFMFQQRFMPNFLLFSQEALTQMAPTADHRTSTYNLFTRYWVETGIIGLALFVWLLGYLFWMARRNPGQRALVGVLLLGTSVGFLLTQEPYCYPPLILGASFILAANSHPKGIRP